MPALPDASGNSAGVDSALSIQWPEAPTQSPAHRPLRLAVMASGDGSNFEALVHACRSGQLAGAVVLLVVNEPNSGARRRAERLAVPCRLLDHRLQPSRDALDQALVAAFEEVEADLVVMAGWMRIVTPRLIDAFPDRLLNIHPSLLPSFRGRDGIADALAAGVTLAGCTAHLVVPEVDAGTILVQAAVPVLPGDDRASLHARIRVQEHRILPLAVRLAAERLAAAACSSEGALSWGEAQG
jgi:phosphoribosylglycinamide formyltransferase-1